MISYSISLSNVNKPTTSTNTKNMYSDLWSPDKNMRTNCGIIYSHLTKLYQLLIIPVRSKWTLLFLYTCFQIYHSPFVILFSNTSPTESWNIFTNKIDI